MWSIVHIVHSKITLVMIIHCLRSKLLCLQRIEFDSLLLRIPTSIKTSCRLKLIKFINLCIQCLNKLSFFELFNLICPLRPLRWWHWHLIFLLHIYSLQWRILLTTARCGCPEARWWWLPGCSSCAYFELMQNVRNRVLRVQGLRTHWEAGRVLVVQGFLGFNFLKIVVEHHCIVGWRLVNSVGGDQREVRVVLHSCRV